MIKRLAEYLRMFKVFWFQACGHHPWWGLESRKMRRCSLCGQIEPPPTLGMSTRFDLISIWQDDSIKEICRFHREAMSQVTNCLTGETVGLFYAKRSIDRRLLECRVGLKIVARFISTSIGYITGKDHYYE